MIKQTIRYSTFETNSSSTHSCVICTEQENQDWRDGKIFWNQWPSEGEPRFFTRDEVIKKMEEDGFTDETASEYEGIDRADYDSEEEFLKAKIDAYCRSDGDIQSYDTFGEDYETDVETREINGEKIVVICYYGYDG